MSDELFIFILIVLLFVCFILLKLERIKERNNKMISKAKKDMIDLESITKNIEEESNKKEFFSIEDLQQRAKLSQPVIDKMRVMGILNDMPETSQLSLF